MLNGKYGAFLSRKSRFLFEKKIGNIFKYKIIG